MNALIVDPTTGEISGHARNVDSLQDVFVSNGRIAVDYGQLAGSDQVEFPPPENRYKVSDGFLVEKNNAVVTIKDRRVIGLSSLSEASKVIIDGLPYSIDVGQNVAFTDPGEYDVRVQMSNGTHEHIIVECKDPATPKDGDLVVDKSIYIAHKKEELLRRVTQLFINMHGNMSRLNSLYEEKVKQATLVKNGATRAIPKGEYALISLDAELEGLTLKEAAERILQRSAEGKQRWVDLEKIRRKLNLQIKAVKSIAELQQAEIDIEQDTAAWHED